MSSIAELIGHDRLDALRRHPLAKIALTVITGHLLVILLLCMPAFSTPVAKPKPPLQIQTVKLNPSNARAAKPKAAPARVEKPQAARQVVEPVVIEEVPEVVPEAPAPAPKPKAAKKPKKKAEETPAKKKSEPKKKTPATDPKPQPVAETKKTPKIAADKLAKARDALKKVDRANPSKSTATAAAAAVPSLNDLAAIDISGLPDATAATAEARYEEGLAGRLQALLTLPDYGSVKVKVTLDRDGNVTSVKVVKAESEENRKYVEKALPNIKCPPFGKNFAGESSHSFQLVLNNAQ